MATVPEALAIAVQHHRAGRLAEAEGIYRRILDAEPGNADALHLLGVVAQGAGRHDIAIDLIARSLAHRPAFADALYNIGISLEAVGRPAEALARYDQALALRPAWAEALNNRGNALKSLRRIDEAVACYRQAIAARPDYARAYSNLAVALDDLGQVDDAVASLRHALALAPDFAEAHTNLGKLLKLVGQVDDAIACYRESLRLKPRSAETLANLGNALRDLYRLDEAEAAYRDAIAIKSDHADAYNGLGAVQAMRGRSDDAMALFDTALRLQPDLAEAHSNRGLALLAAGRVRDGLDEYEWRWGTPQLRRSARRFTRPQWDGSGDLSGRTILVWGEQGVGDEVLWAAFLPDVIARAGRCIVECRPKLVPLFARSFPGAEVRAADTASDATRTDFDVHLPMGSLFRALGAAAPRSDVFLTPNPERVALWKGRLVALGRGPSVGIAWTSSVVSAVRTHGYTRLEEWAPIFAIENAVFVSLQPGDHSAELAEAERRFGITVHAFADLDLFDDLDDVAALAAALDVGVCVDTAVAHIVAGVGTAVWRLTWRQAPTHSVLYALPGPKVAYAHRDTDEPWAAAFAEVASRLRGNGGDHIPAMLAVGAGHHGAGNLAEADAIYRRILLHRPDHPDALHLLGVVAHQVGRHEVAADLIGKVVAANPDFAEAHGNLANALQALGRSAEAIEHYHRAIALKPGFTEAVYNMGVALEANGDLDRAAAAYRRAIAQSPNHVNAHFNLANVAKAMGRLEEAVAGYRDLLAFAPHHADARANLGNCLHELERLDEAEACYRAVIASAPTPLAYRNLGNTLKALGQVHGDRVRVDEAVACYRAALALDPRYAEAHDGLGSAYCGRGEIERAVEHFGKALTLAPDSADIRVNHALALFLGGRLSEAWAEYEWRWRHHSSYAARPFPQPWWTGEPLDGRTLLVWAEQGLADEILGIGMLCEAMERAPRCVVECDPRLVDLFARSFPTATVVPRRTPPHPKALAADVHIPLFGLGQFFRRQRSDFPHRPHYLVADKARAEHWKRWLDGLGPGLKIGLSWRGRLPNRERSRHFPPLDLMGTILTIPGLVFVNLQYDDFAEDVAALRTLTGVPIHCPEEIDLTNDLDEVAALMTGLDAVVGPATAVGDLAGALGRPTWMYAYHPMSNEKEICDFDHVPWCPAIRVETSGFGEGWSGALTRTAASLRAFAAGV